jgi:ABC-2 type transport system ATP-binding protein
MDDPVAVKERIGYLPESVPLYGDLTVDEYLRFVADARLIPRGKRRSRVEEAIARCGLGEKRGQRIETLSKGYKQRTGLAQAIVHDPPVLILDEPTTGLDPNQIIEIRSLIRELGRTKTVILSTHILQEVDAVCNQVLILNEGKIAAQGTPESIAGTMKGGENWDVLLKAADGGRLSADGLRANIQSFARDAALAVDIGSVEANTDGTARAAFFIQSGGETEQHTHAERIFDWAVASNLKILSMNKKKLSLEDIFVKLTA